VPCENVVVVVVVVVLLLLLLLLLLQVEPEEQYYDYISCGLIISKHDLCCCYFSSPHTAVRLWE